MAEYDYQLKFVITDQKSMDEALTLIERLEAPAHKIVLMPEGTTETVLNERGVWVAELCKQHGFRFSPRLHVHLYGHRRGV
jgi:7-carboxy-7-deazaguanine synthase